MHGSRHSQRGLRLGAFGLFLTGLGVLAVLWQTGRAGGTPFSPKVAAVFDKNELIVGVGLNRAAEPLSGTLRIELIDDTGPALDPVAHEVDQKDSSAQYRAAFKVGPKTANTGLIRVSLGGKTHEVALKKALLAKAHETSLAAGTEYYAGSQVALRCGVHGVVNLTETIPLAGSDVTVRLTEKGGKVHDLYKGKTGRDGLANIQFEMPALAAGEHNLEIVTRSAFGQEKLQRQVRVRSDAKVLLVSDKPIYQPGQLMHLRALVLRSFDQRPVANKDIVFEVEDPKGNKVYKKTFQTNEFGVASVDFQLADEVNMGDYHIRALVGETKAEKTVGVKRYVLPKFKVEVKANKTFYLPKEKVEATIQSDYFFSKAVANAKVEVIASTFDVQFRKFFTFNTTTDENGHAKFDIQLPDYFVGQPLQQGNALVKFDVTVTDTADHAEKLTKTYTVSDQPIRVSLIAEGGKLAPGVENRVFAATTYPDGSPAPDTQVKVWHRKNAQPGGPGGPGVPLVQPGRGGPPPAKVDAAPAKPQAAVLKDLGEPLAVVKTNAAGLAEIKLNPKAEEFRQGGFAQQTIETLGGNQVIHGPQVVFDVVAEATDAKRNKATVAAELNSHPLGENVLLRLDKAIYNTGDVMNIDVRSSAGLPTVYVDVVRGGQIMLSRWLEVKDGQATQKLDLPSTVYGSIEIHAYQMLSHGEIIRDSRVAYVQPKNDLKIAIDAQQTEYAPGENGRIRFTVTDSAGKPTQAALGVVIVDEAVYALQDMQPGLEKVYFTLQEELLKPSAQIHYSPGAGIDNIILQPAVRAPQQQVAEVLLTAVKLPAPARWNVAPEVERKNRVEQQVATVGNFLFWYASDPSAKFQEFDKAAGKWVFRDGLLEELTKTRGLPPQTLEGIFGGKLDLSTLAKLEKDFTPEQLAKAVTANRINQVSWTIIHHTNQNAGRYKKGNAWMIPETVIQEAVKSQRLHEGYAKDAWGRAIRLARRSKAGEPFNGNKQLEMYDIVSSGPDGRFGTKDDVTQRDVAPVHFSGLWWADGERTTRLQGVQLGQLGGMRRDLLRNRAMPMFEGAEQFQRFGGGFGGPVPANAPPAPRAAMPLELKDAAMAKKAEPDAGAANAAAPPESGGAPITRVREYFPETMLWQPALITDAKGSADLGVNFADSITTWRLSASANATSGALGGATVPLKVFQDFFVDIDVPVSLTQGDEITLPIAVYNYLKTPQKLTLTLEKEPWYELLDSDGLTRTLNVNPGDVTAVKYRIRATKIGSQPLTVKAVGSKKSDAVKRIIDVVPSGQKFEKVVTDRLSNPDPKGGEYTIRQNLEIPAAAQAEASKLFVRIYPGAMAQVVDGLDGMLRMPTGCFEQTSSAAYPNILIVDYIRKNKIASPQVLMKAEQYLNTGYQRLLTFERPGGGFDWWGREEPLVWLSAYGLQEFADMAKVWTIDRGIIDRTQKFLMNKRDKDGTWSNIGATHGETIASMGDPKLLLTSYVTWSLLESGFDKKQLAPSVQYIRDHLKDAGESAYILALAANALAAFDAKDDSTLEALTRLDKLRKELPEWRAVNFPGKATSLTYARGDGVTIETTALAAYAMIKTGQFTASANQALTYLVKTKQGDGTWGSTQATILSLKALLAGMGADAPKEPVHFTIKVNGADAARGKVDADNADVLQAFEIKKFNRTGTNDVQITTSGQTSLMYQIVSRHYQPWQDKPETKRPVIDLDVGYDRTKLSTNDMLRAKATLKYHGQIPTYMVMLDLGIAPGFAVDPGDFAEMVDKGTIKKFSLTPRQVILYLGDVKPGDTLTFEYTLRPKYALRARTAPSTAYEYNTPANRAEARPVELVVEDRK